MSLVAFRFPKLDYIKSEAEKKKRKREWEAQFAKWGVPVSQEIAFEQPTLQQIITSDGLSDDESARLLVEWADTLGAILQEQRLTTNQLRNFFGEVRQIQRAGFEKTKRRFILLTPKIEYAAVRDG